MPEHNPFLIFIRPLNRIGIRYFTTGSVASIFYGEPRLTHDIDLVLKIGKKQLREFSNAFSLDHFYCPPEDIIVLELKRPYRGHFNIIHHKTGFKADIYTVGEDKLNIWALQTRKKVEFEGEELYLAPIEYVILRKLEYYREGKSEKHLNDIRGILSLSTDQIDVAELENLISERGLQREWQTASKV